jgi:polysaccharide biosynthesis/export protein ExoF
VAGATLERKYSLQSISVWSACRFARNGVRALLSTATKLVAVSLVLVPAAWAGEYQLGVQDKLRIRVVEWQTIEGTFREWDAVSGEYTVGASGSLSLPLVGDTPASGKTTAEIAAAIGETLQLVVHFLDRRGGFLGDLELLCEVSFNEELRHGRLRYRPGLCSIAVRP